ncbi:MAG TPA: hypothetical protein VEC35_05630 [Noviherbaspirillum sp.]|nr:hypothetical protein [Noviherbaspirillum sp.]
MQNTQHTHTPLQKLATVSGLILGGLGFLLSFVLAMLMLVQKGNPGFLMIWGLTVAITWTCMRAHARMRRSFERMYAPEAVRVFLPARKGWRHDVEDVAFRDIPDASMSF